MTLFRLPSLRNPTRGALMMVVIGGLSCAGREGGTENAAFGLAVGALTLPGVDYVCYDVEVSGPDGRVVRLGDPTRTYLDGDDATICSWQYGNEGGGDISYVAPCDADDGDGQSPAQADNTVTIWFDGIYRDSDGDHDPAEDVDIGDWQDPCPGGCTTTVVCRENRDAEVAFDFTVMRDAHQGFFDIGVDFDDIFCSAKLDCVDALLHDGDGDRGPTVIVAFACTAGPGAPTWLHTSDLVLTCDDADPLTPPLVETLSAATPGQHGARAPGVFQWATYQGEEHLTSGVEPLEKCYFNRAVGLATGALVGKSCRVTATATATDTPTLGEALSTATRYPVLAWDVEVLSPTGALCGNQALDANGSGVTTAYLEPAAQPLPPLTTTMQCGDASSPGEVIDDGNACTDDILDPVTGTTSHVDSTPPGACCDPSDGAITETWAEFSIACIEAFCASDPTDPLCACPTGAELGLDMTGAEDVSAELDALVDTHDCLDLSGTLRLAGDVTVNAPTLRIIGAPTFVFAANNIFFRISASHVHIEDAVFDFGGLSFGRSGEQAAIIVGPELDDLSLAGGEFFDIVGQPTRGSANAHQVQQYAVQVSANNTRIDLSDTYFHHIGQIAPNLNWCGGSCDWQAASFCGGIFITHDFANGYEPGGVILVRNARFEAIESLPNPGHQNLRRNGDAIRSYMFPGGSDASGTRVIVEDTEFYNVDTSSTKLTGVASEVRRCRTESTLASAVPFLNEPMYVAHRANQTSSFLVEDVEVYGRVQSAVVVDGSNIVIRGVRDYTNMTTLSNDGALHSVQIGQYGVSTNALIEDVVVDALRLSAVYLKYADGVEIRNVSAPGVGVQRLLFFDQASNVTVEDFTMHKGILFSLGATFLGASFAHDIALSRGRLDHFQWSQASGAYIARASNIALDDISIVADCPECTNTRLELGPNVTDLTTTDCNF